MPRVPRIDKGGIAYHVLNRANGRMRMFHTDADYEAFIRVIDEAKQRLDLRICSYCIMPNHWHFVVWPEQDDQVSDFFRWLGVTHANRLHAHHGTAGQGHVYQGRFKSFPVQRDAHFLVVCRYVEANALRASLVKRAEDWMWSSLWLRLNDPNAARVILSEWPVDVPRNWVQLVNQPVPKADLDTLRLSNARGRPFGTQTWMNQTADALDLNSTLRPRGRPRLNEKVSGTFKKGS